MIVLDTHVVLWADSDDRRLGRKTRALLDREWPVNKVAIPAVVFWEVGLLQIAGRLQVAESVGAWREGLIAAGARELPLTGAIGLRAAELTGLHADPADRFIAATALVHAAMLVTADDRLLRWKYDLERHDARL